MVGTRKSAAKAAGVSSDTLQRWIREEVQPSLGPIIKLADAAGVSVEWLATGRECPRGVAEVPGVYDKDDVIFALVPQYDVEASAGGGSLVECESEIGKLAFRRDWIQKKCLSAKDLVVIRITGDSMSPTIRDGSLVLVDTRQERLQEDGIYVLVVDGHLIAKRLQTDFRGGVYIRSDNEAYRDEHLNADEAINLFITGRVVWAGGEI